MSNLVDFASKELDLILEGCNAEDRAMQEKINNDIKNIVEMFASQGHTGLTASYVIPIIERLLRYQPLSPLTGNDDEWRLVDEGDITYQNMRCPSVFKYADGRVLNVEGKVFSNDNGHTWFTCKDSCVEVQFPYEVPKMAEPIILKRAEREMILEKLKSITDMETMTEDTLVSGILTNINPEQLLLQIKTYYNVEISLDNCNCVWELISRILNELEEGR